MVYIFILFAIIIISFIVLYFLRKNHDYWKKRNVPHLKPLLLFGNYKESILLKKHQALVAQDICNHFPDEPYIGTFYGTEPALIIQDPEIIKLIMTTDFSYFSGRAITDYSHKELLTKNLIFSGGDVWKIQRQNLAPLFTSAKIKGMFHLIIECANQLEGLIYQKTRDSACIEAKNLLAKYTIDCVTSCAFGINSNTMTNETVENPFIKLSKKIFESSKIRSIKWNCRLMWPGIFYGLGFSVFHQSIPDFFQKLLNDIFEKRHNMKSSRNDFIDLILSWKKKEVITGESLNLKNSTRKVITLEVNQDLLTTQCIMIFSAGFETTSTTLSFVLYEIAKNIVVQTKVIEEVDAYFEKNNGIIKYECVNELPYLAACIDETLRLYPVLGLLTREVMEDYTLPSGLCLQKGDRVHIPMNHIHRNPKFFPEPESFMPDRFYGDKRKMVKPFTFLPFGEGPRMCLGLRFSKMPMYVALLTIFKNYLIDLAENMPRSVILQPASIVISSVNAINLKFISRKI